MASKRKCTKQKLVNLGFTAAEVQATEELAAKRSVSTPEVLRIAVLQLAAVDRGYASVKWGSDYDEWSISP